MTRAFVTLAALVATAATASPALADHDCDTKVAKGITLKASFAYDRGCMFEAIIVRGKAYTDIAAATPKAMVQLGWAKANQAKREEIAMMWITDVLASIDEYRLVYSTENTDFKTFHEPKTTSKDGAVTIRFWSDTTVIGMRMPETRDYAETEVTIDAKGKLTVTAKDSFQEPWK